MLLRKDSASGAISSARSSVLHLAGAASRGTTLAEYDHISFKEVLQVCVEGGVGGGLRMPYKGPRGSSCSGRGNSCYLSGSEGSWCYQRRTAQ